MQIETSSIPEKNVYHETFKMSCFLGETQGKLKPEIVELMLIHVGLIHNAMGLAFMEIVKAYAFLSNKMQEITEKNQIENNDGDNKKELSSQKKNENLITNDKADLSQKSIKSQKDGISIIIEKCEDELFSSVKSLKTNNNNNQNEIIVTETNIKKNDDNQKKTSFLVVNKLAERIQKNNKKTSQEKIAKILKSSKKKKEQQNENSESENNSSMSISTENSGHLAYTKNFKKKKSEDIVSNIPLKRIKENMNENSNSTIHSKKPFRSKRKFLINQKESEAMQFSQSLRENGISELFKPENVNNKTEIVTNEIITTESMNDGNNPFRQTYRKKEERDKLKGFACDQCEKFYKALGRGMNLDLCKCTSRHKDLFEISNTPEAFHETEIIKFEKEEGTEK